MKVLESDCERVYKNSVLYNTTNVKTIFGNEVFAV